MKLRYVGLVAASLLLTGCTSADWDQATLFSSPTPDDADAPTMAPVPDTSPTATPSPSPQASRAETFCKGYAQSQAWNASQLGSSERDQAHISDTEFQQCMARSDHWVD